MLLKTVVFTTYNYLFNIIHMDFLQKKTVLQKFQMRNLYILPIVLHVTITDFTKILGMISGNHKVLKEMFKLDVWQASVIYKIKGYS